MFPSFPNDDLVNLLVSVIELPGYIRKSFAFMSQLFDLQDLELGELSAFWLFGFLYACHRRVRVTRLYIGHPSSTAPDYFGYLKESFPFVEKFDYF